ncbi:hypothetical protein AB0I22_36970 [Streptomyces sp. NPDC050610]|uniref:hypothetical protein n=1 Tax=Streptomyces sp. NPDC050610 TaxID=3157097 RepID=UPI003420220D
MEQGYKQVKDELGWANFQVRSKQAIRRHQVLVHCAFSFCWDTWFIDGPGADPPPDGAPETGHRRRAPGLPTARAARVRSSATPDLAQCPAPGPLLADPRHRARTLLARLVEGAPTR